MLKKTNCLRCGDGQSTLRGLIFMGLETLRTYLWESDLSKGSFGVTQLAKKLRMSPLFLFSSQTIDTFLSSSEQLKLFLQ